MANIKIEGKILKILDERQISESFIVQSVWIQDNDKYPNLFDIQFSNNNISKLKQFQKGDEVVIDVNVRGRGYTDKQGNKRVFNSLDGWKISPAEKRQPQIQNDDTEEEDDLPF